ncbi:MULTISPECIES: hypothetical protein [unclassified Polaribacter]|uniref:hypothetical protein n=1 Tax=unclassified Polaribacter TaxID=196858 RepID=UPI0011BEF026|nr:MULTISPECIES: hypothetical protein [unclassified Polaribacter]TXD52970.1 hypothetical protein ES043_06250 [Polaribacter sp. IC063]
MYILDKRKVHEQILNHLDDKFITIKTDIHIETIETAIDVNFISVTHQHKEIYVGKILDA